MLTAVARDAAGNTKTSTAVTVTVSNTTGGGDTTAPTVAITGPAGGATVSGTAQVSASASDNVGVVGVQFKLDGANLGAEDTSAPYAVSWNTTTATNGTHTLTAVARDAAGNTTTSAGVTVTVSNTTGGGGAPTVSITTPFDGDWTGNTLHIAATASGGTTALTSVKIYGNGGVVLETTCSGTSCTLDDWWTTGTLSPGGYQIQAVATNSAGAWTTSPPITIYKDATSPIVASGAPPSGSGGGGDPPPPPPPPSGGGDTTAPTVTITSPSNGKTIGLSVKVSAKGVDNVKMASLKLYGNGVLFAEKVCDRASCTLTGTWKTSTLPSGQHTITAVGTDTSGNTTTSAPLTVNK
jgi:hypothetical protein